MQRRLPWGSFPLGEMSFGLLNAPVYLVGATPLRVPSPRSESALASWLCFAPHPPTGFGLQGFSRPGSRTPLGAVASLSLESAAVTRRPRRHLYFQHDTSKCFPSSLSQNHFKLRSTSSSTHTVKTAKRLGERLLISPKLWLWFRIVGPSPQEPHLR